jgi:hypothetical protein
MYMPPLLPSDNGKGAGTPAGQTEVEKQIIPTCSYTLLYRV